MSRKRIAVIGAGAAGITAAHLLQEKHDVVLFERSATLGGHASPVRIESKDDAPGFELDTAFVIYNDRSYPSFLKLMRRLGLHDFSQEAEMSFSFCDHGTGLEFATNKSLDALFAQRRNLFSPRFHRIFYDLLRFRSHARGDLARGMDAVSLDGYFERRGYSDLFRKNLMFPLAMSAWSVPTARMRDFPARTFFRYLDNHGYLGGGTDAKWRSFRGSSGTYLKAFRNSFRGEIREGREVESVSRRGEGVWVRAAGAAEERFDEGVLACHSDRALALLADPSESETRLLGAWSYQESDTWLHTDASLMPKDPKLWTSWNIDFDSRPGADAQKEAVTYHLNRVQHLPTKRDYFITLGGVVRIAPETVIRRFKYRHPVFEASSVATQEALPSLNGVNRTWFCGSYFGFGFHEDAIRSGAAVAARFGVHL